jgi:hypothetical protein
MYFLFSVFRVLFVCKCVLYCCRRLSTQFAGDDDNNNNHHNSHNNNNLKYLTAITYIFYVNMSA